MIDLYSWRTPNGRKVSVMLEEVKLPYTAHGVDIGQGAQFEPDFLKISPNNKIPAIVDRSTSPEISVFESGAILIYLAEKTDSPLLPKEAAKRAKTMEWLMFQMGGLGPMFGQLGHFAHFAQEKIPYGINRYKTEVDRLLGVLDKRLAQSAYMAGDDLTIADIATYPWLDTLKNFYNAVGDLTFPATPAIDRWYETLSQREAFQKGMQVLKA